MLSLAILTTANKAALVKGFTASEQRTMGKGVKECAKARGLIHSG